MISSISINTKGEYEYDGDNDRYVVEKHIPCQVSNMITNNNDNDNDYDYDDYDDYDD